MQAPGITLKSAALTYKHTILFQDLTLHFPASTWTTVLGQTGIGKSSILRALASLTALDAGTIITTDNAPLINRIAYMTQDAGLLPWYSVLDNVLIGCRLRGRVTQTL